MTRIIPSGPSSDARAAASCTVETPANRWELSSVWQAGRHVDMEITCQKWDEITPKLPCTSPRTCKRPGAEYPAHPPSKTDEGLHLPNSPAKAPRKTLQRGVAQQ